VTHATTDAAALYAAIFAHPDEDVPRLMYADCIEEHDAARAEFIRVQVELARLPSKPRELFVTDGAGKRLEGLGVALTPRGDGHYSASDAERGLSIESFAPNERVDVYAHFARGGRVGWLRGLKYVRHVEGRGEIVFRKDAESGPWVGTALAVRERELLAANGIAWRKGPVCRRCYISIDALSGAIKRDGCVHCDGTGDAGGLLRKFAYECEGDAVGLYDAPVKLTYRRGFPFRVEVPRLDDVLEERTEPCPTCEGRRSRGVTFAGQMYWPDCESCKGNGVVSRGLVATPWLAAVLDAHRTVAEVVPLDVPIGHDVAGGDEPYCVYESDLPQPLAAAFADQWFPTPEAATSALGRAVVAVGKGG
jgi:uncharacterized protein (TIGR02996 family)